MPKKIDPKVKERCVRQVLEHLPEYPSLTAAAESVARREGLGKETVRRWVVQAQIDGGQRQGATSEELAEIKDLKAKVRRLEEDNEILRRARFSSRGSSTTECIRTTVFHSGPYRTIGDVEYATAGWVDWYNNRRLHSTLGMMTPVEFKQAHYATLNRELQPV